MAIEQKVIEGVQIGGKTFADRWGVCGLEYSIKTSSATATASVQVDFQDLMINVSEYRAVSIEQEVLPMESRMRWRNKMLEKLGTALSEITGYTNKIDTQDKKPEDQKVTNVSWSADAKEALEFSGAADDLRSLNSQTGEYEWYETLRKYQLDKANQQVKTKTDRLNNDSSQDSTRLQSLVDHRDQAYQTATTLMTSISDVRTNLIRNIG